jgi:hypothetical protein
MGASQRESKIITDNTLRFFNFLSNIAIFLSIGLLKGPPSYGRNLQPSKKNIQRFKNENN